MRKMRRRRRRRKKKKKKKKKKDGRPVGSLVWGVLSARDSRVNQGIDSTEQWSTEVLSRLERSGLGKRYPNLESRRMQTQLARGGYSCLEMATHGLGEVTRLRRQQDPTF